MQNDNLQRLGSLKESVLNDLQPLITSLDLPVEQQFNLFLASARSSGNAEMFEKAYQAAGQLTDETKANALLDLLDAIDESVGSATSLPAENSNPEELQPVSSQDGEQANQ